MIKKLASRVVYQNKWMTVREDEVEFADGTRGIYGVVEKTGAALIIPKLSPDEYVLVKTYRYPIGRWAWEFPHGGVEDTGIKPEEIARRELAEEAGYTAKKLHRLASLHVAFGFTDLVAHIYLAEELVPGKRGREPGEIGMEVRIYSTDEVEGMIKSGGITDSQTIAAWTILKLKG